MSGLSINSVSNLYSPYSAQSAGSGAASSFQALGQALQSGNLGSARAAFGTLQKTFQTQTSLTQSSSWSSLVGRVEQIAQALNAGDLTSAQATYANLQQDLQLQSQSAARNSTPRPSGSNQS
jgi:hypothetical protein